MKLKEYIGKRLFEAYGISIPMGFVISKKSLETSNMSQIHDRLDFLKNDIILKAQTLNGERQKGDLILKSDDKDFAKNALNIFKKIGDNEILVEENIKIKNELYCSLSISGVYKAPVLTISEGKKASKSLVFKDLNNAKIRNFVKEFPMPNVLMHFVFNMYKLMIDKDCIQIEINPLVVSNIDGEDRLLHEES